MAITSWVGTSGNDSAVAILDLIYDVFSGQFIFVWNSWSMRGLAGNDTLTGGPFGDDIYGGDGKDTLSGLAGSDDIYGENGNDLLYGGSGNDLLYGGSGKDYLYGGTDNDYLYGENGDDYLYGDDGDDFLKGGKGNDVLSGGNGNDVLNGYGASIEEYDLLAGGSGKDKFILGDNSVYYTGLSGAVIADFDRIEEDKIQLKGSAADYRLIKNADFGGTSNFDTQLIRGEDFIALLIDTTKFSLSYDVLYV